jgi:hypothetical protein
MPGRKPDRRTDVCFREQSGKHLLALSFSGFDPGCGAGPRPDHPIARHAALLGKECLQQTLSACLRDSIKNLDDIACRRLIKIGTTRRLVEAR